jgi:hypothetical protein
MRGLLGFKAPRAFRPFNPFANGTFSPFRASLVSFGCNNGIRAREKAGRSEASRERFMLGSSCGKWS